MVRIHPTTSPPVCDCESQRPQLNLQFLIQAICIAVVSISLCPFFTPSGCSLMVAYGLTFLCGCWKTKRATLFVLPAMYLPFIWVWFVSWGSRGGLLGKQTFWQLPGLSILLSSSMFPALWIDWVSSLLTLAIFLTCIMFARPKLRIAATLSIPLACLAGMGSFYIWGLFSLLSR